MDKFLRALDAEVRRSLSKVLSVKLLKKKKKFSACSRDQGQESIVISDLELNISPL